MWWALLYCMLIPLFLCEQVTFTGEPDTNPYVPEDASTYWYLFCVDTPKVPAYTSHPTIDVVFDFESELLEDILVYWGNSTDACVGTSDYASTKQITIRVAENGTSQCFWDIKQLGTARFFGMVNATAILSTITIFETAEEYIDVPIIKPCGHERPHNHDETTSPKSSVGPDGYDFMFPGSSDKELDPPSRPFLSGMPLLESEIEYILEETSSYVNTIANEETTLFNLIFGMSLGACFLVIVITLFFANCAFISGKKKKKPIYVAGDPETTYYLDYPAGVFTPPTNEPAEYFIQPPHMTVVQPDPVALVETPSQFNAFQPTVLTQPIKYFNLLYLLKHVVNTREPVVTESI